jgi:PIN domain nuclease of toxin-antitoxin system
MNLLLDSHIWLWSVLERHRLSPEVDAKLRDPGNEWWISAATCWEIMILYQKKRMDLDPDAATWIHRALEVQPVHEVPINREIAILSRTLDLGTEDPVDRFLAATAIVYDLTLVTADEHLIACQKVRTLSNR